MMPQDPNPAEDRAVDLLVARVTEGLPSELDSELEALLATRPHLDPESFERAAAVIDLAYTVPDEPLPAVLYERLVRRARMLELPEAPGPAADRQTLAPVAAFPGRGPEEPRRDLTPWLGWLAAAAVLFIAVGLWPETERTPSPATARAELVAAADDVIELAWTATEDPAAADAGGDVVWSTALQHGYMRFRGLPANDPAVEQYQLWIFDAQRDERFPIDGGVFDVPAGEEVVVPIQARLPIAEPTLFAITIEPPGGVVVSSRERLPLLAQVG